MPVLNSKGFGNRTLVQKNGEESKDRKGGISVAVLATTVATAFLFGMLLISILMLRKRRFEEQRLDQLFLQRWLTVEYHSMLFIIHIECFLFVFVLI